MEWTIRIGCYALTLSENYYPQNPQNLQVMTPAPITTFEQFLEAIPKDGWVLNKYHFVRRGGCQCPITSLDEKPACYYDGVGRTYGMSSDLISRVAKAADCREYDLDTDYYPTHTADRQALLAAVGLQEADPV